MSTSIIHIHPTKQSSWQWRNFSMVKTRMEQPFYDLSGNDITGRSHQKQFSIRKTKQYWCLFCLLRALSPNIIKWMNIFVRVHLIFFSNFILRVIWSVANSKRIRETWFFKFIYRKDFSPILWLKLFLRTDVWKVFTQTRTVWYEILKIQFYCQLLRKGCKKRGK